MSAPVVTNIRLASRVAIYTLEPPIQIEKVTPGLAITILASRAEVHQHEGSSDMIVRLSDRHGAGIVWYVGSEPIPSIVQRLAAHTEGTM